MEYSRTILRDEIKAVVDRTIEVGMRVRSSWIATEICKAHSNIFGRDIDFWKYAGITGIHAEVRKVISLIKSDEDSPEQKDLPFIVPGYKHLQRIYFTPTLEDPDNDEVVGIPLTVMTYEQIEYKAQEYERMSAGCLEHAEELRRYAKTRQQTA